MLRPGTRVGVYEILRPLDEGGMGEVYRARDTELQRDVAIKALRSDRSDHPDSMARLQREAKTLASLNHPSIVTVHAIVDYDDHHLIVMELVDGETLDRRLQSHPHGFSLPEFFRISLALSEAIGVAHEQDIIHRDLKPANVMITRFGLKVLDFGLAKGIHKPIYTASTTKFLTTPGITLGTFPYMSPEQVNGQDLGPQSDVFSLGVMMYELLRGEPPFRGRTIGAIMHAVTSASPVPLATVRTDLPASLIRIVERCLVKDEGGRFADAGQLHTALMLEAQAHLAAEPRARPARGSWTFTGILRSREGLSLLLALTFLANWIETSVDRWFGPGPDLGYQLAGAFAWFEGNVSFERHDLTGPVGVYAASIAYFVVPVLLPLLVFAAFWRRPEIAPFRVAALAIVISYAISVVFFMFMPVPERWAYPPSEAMLLSDLWSSKLIETIRPISGLDNCFPSFHVSGTVDLVLASLLFQLQYRRTVALLGAAVILSTYVLGIHWMADIIAGSALGLVSVRLAVRWNTALSQPA